MAFLLCSVLIFNLPISASQSQNNEFVGSPDQTLFSDGFETGDFSAWTGTWGFGTHNETVSSEYSTEGNFSAKFAVYTQDGVSYAYKDGMSVTGVLVLEYTLTFNRLPATYPEEIVFGGFHDNQNQERILVILRRNLDNTICWGLLDSSYHFESQPSNPSVDTVYRITLVLDKQNSQSKLYINGTQKIYTSSTWTKSSYIFNVGIEAAYMNTEAGLIAHIDEVTVTDYLEPEPTPTPTPTPTTTPTPTPTPATLYTLTMTMTATVGPETVLSTPIQASWIATDGTLYAGSNETLYRSPDQGVTWEPLKNFSNSLSSVFVDSRGYIYASPYPVVPASDTGLWMSNDTGETWSRVLSLPDYCCIWGIDEDSNGTIFAGVYTVGEGSSNANARIYRSNNGTTWQSVYYDASARHIHDVAIDKSNNYIYASVGDQWDPWYIQYIIRSTDGGDNWTQILTGMPQIVAIGIVPGARLFGTDASTNGEIYRTTDDLTFSRVFDTGGHSYGFWFAVNDVNGEIYASFLSGDYPNQVSGIYKSSNNGESWSVYKTFNITNHYQGSPYASNFVGGTMYYSVVTGTGWGNGVRIYTSYSADNGNSYGYSSDMLIQGCTDYNSVNNDSAFNVPYGFDGINDWGFFGFGILVVSNRFLTCFFKPKSSKLDRFRSRLPINKVALITKQ